MLDGANIVDVYWKEIVHTAVYILNRVQLRLRTNYTPYELWYGKSACVKYFRIFGSKCYIKKDDANLSSFESKRDEGIFLGYSSLSKAYRCYNKRLKKIIESANVEVDEKLQVSETTFKI